MLVNRYQTVYLSFIATDLPIWNVIEATASLYQTEPDKFYLLLNQQNSNSTQSAANLTSLEHQDKSEVGLFWLEITPNRIMLTMQSHNRLSYRHFWEKGTSGVSRYCLTEESDRSSTSLRFRNFTRYLKVEQDPFPSNIRIEYELWSKRIQLGSYILHLDIDN